MRRSPLPPLLGFLGSFLLSSAAPPGRAAELRDLRDLDEIRTLVDRDKTIPRLVLLLSPT